ncbi:MAG: alkaline phosphatase family protein [Deltaproteobacteria bacterium]|nr:alkaline phosphatase family protein [Deltaproteobacteria bacterium]
MGISRREALIGLGAALSTAAFGCGGDAAGTAGADAKPDGAPDAAPDAVPPPDAYDACAAVSPLDAAALLAGIDHVIVLCMENRSFDHALGALRLVEGRADIDGLRGTETNPDPSGAPVAVHPLDDFTPADPPHDWDPCHAQWNNGANDGFVKAHAGASQADVMGYHVRAQLPISWALADQGAVCQRWFASVMGPTWPNRFYLHGATSKGMRSNLPVVGFTSIWQRLADAGVSGVNYYHDVPWAAGGYAKLTGNAPVEQFFEDALVGRLPAFALIDPQFFGAGANDDHPDHDVRLGQALIASVVNVLGQSPQWAKCLLIVTYDEHGGFYDHVPPPTTVDEDPEFQQLGFRVPTIAIGPGVRRGCAIDTVFEHSSIAATLTRRFGLAPLNARAEAAADLSSVLDPRRVDDPAPPLVLPPVPLSRRALAARPEVATHGELAAAIDGAPLPAGLDRRGESAAITARVLGWAERLGAIRWVD